jgi:hypothetical protein
VQDTKKAWLLLAARMVVFVIACCACLATRSHLSIADERAKLPNTAAGQCAAAHFDAFNSGNDRMMRAFLKEYRSISYLERNPVDKRLAYYQRLRGIFGQLNPLRITLSQDLQLTLLADAVKTEDAVVMRFQLERESRHHLAYVTFTGIDHFQVSDEYVAYVATRATPIDKTIRESTIQSVAQVLRDSYVYPMLGRQMADAFLQNQAEGRYADLTKAGKLADKLTEDALAISNDKHIWVEAQNPMIQESTDPVNRPVEELRRDNYHFRKVEVLPGNIGYIKFDMIHDDEEAKEIAATALAFVARCDALIFDLRDNIGGEWGAAELTLGHLFPGGTVFAHVYDRDGRRIDKRSTPDAIPGEAIGSGVVVYVLTSSQTGSAAEGFAYYLKHLGRATIVGEVTQGMAHPSKEVVVNDHFRVSVPFMRSETVITGTDWEGKGVVPQIEVTADRALETAVEDALRRMGNHK